MDKAHDPRGGHLLRRSVVALVLGLTAGAAVAAAPAGATPRAATGGAVVHTPSSCSGVSITTFAFRPRVVAEGATTKLVTAISNCTARPFTGSLETFGRLPCEVVDPISTPIKVAPRSTVRDDQSFTAPSCTGRGHITGRLDNKNGHVVSTRTAPLRVVS